MTTTTIATRGTTNDDAGIFTLPHHLPTPCYCAASALGQSEERVAVETLGRLKGRVVTYDHNGEPRIGVYAGEVGQVTWFMSQACFDALQAEGYVGPCAFEVGKVTVAGYQLTEKGTILMKTDAINALDKKATVATGKRTKRTPEEKAAAVAAKKADRAAKKTPKAGRTPMYLAAKEIITRLGGRVTRETVAAEADKAYGVNATQFEYTLRAITVNNLKRVKWGINREARACTNEAKDVLFAFDGNKELALFDPAQHGEWAIVATKDGGFEVANTKPVGDAPKPPKGTKRAPKKGTETGENGETGAAGAIAPGPQDPPAGDDEKGAAVAIPTATNDDPLADPARLDANDPNHTAAVVKAWEFQIASLEQSMAAADTKAEKASFANKIKASKKELKDAQARVPVAA